MPYEDSTRAWWEFGVFDVSAVFASNATEGLYYIACFMGVNKIHIDDKLFFSLPK